MSVWRAQVSERMHMNTYMCNVLSGPGQPARTWKQWQRAIARSPPHRLPVCAGQPLLRLSGRLLVGARAAAGLHPACTQPAPNLHPICTQSAPDLHSGCHLVCTPPHPVCADLPPTRRAGLRSLHCVPRTGGARRGQSSFATSLRQSVAAQRERTCACTCNCTSECACTWQARGSILRREARTLVAWAPGAYIYMFVCA